MAPKRESSSNGESSPQPAKKQALDCSNAYDSDEAPPPLKSGYDKILWRQGLEESLSDWTIEVSFTDNSGKNKTDTYHVHKSNLAAESRKSEYFARLFKDGGRFAESGSSTSRIELDEIAAKAFPIFLDYMYLVESDLKISISSATALHYLGGYFEIRRLRWDAKQFWQTDLNGTTCQTYYEHAKTLHDDKIKKAATKMCALHILKITESSRLLLVPDEEFWIHLLDSLHQSRANVSLHASKLLASYFNNCGASVEAFNKLTDAEYIRYVHRDAAIKLIEAERVIVQPDESCLTELQKRCIKAIIDDWFNFGEINESDLSLLQKQSLFLLTKMLSDFAASSKKGAEERVKETSHNAELRAIETARVAVAKAVKEECGKLVRINDERVKEASRKAELCSRLAVMKAVQEERGKFVRININNVERNDPRYGFLSIRTTEPVTAHPQDTSASESGCIATVGNSRYACYRYS